jgi:hypothetical protein
MGDSCYFKMTVLKEDVKQINEIMFGDDSDGCWAEVDDNNDGTVTLIDYDANYGYHDQREKLAEAGIIFEGFHGPGGEYGECHFACYDGSHIAVSSVEGGPVVSVSRSGANEEALKCVHKYYATLDSVEKHFKDNSVSQGGKKQ